MFVPLSIFKNTLKLIFTNTSHYPVMCSLEMSVRSPILPHIDKPQHLLEYRGSYTHIYSVPQWKYSCKQWTSNSVELTHGLFLTVIRQP